MFGFAANSILVVPRLSKSDKSRAHLREFGAYLRGCMYQHDFEGYRQERLKGVYRKWHGKAPWELSHYQPPANDAQG